ncbi:histone-lysine N-methyltransferase SETMAR [Trichonephila clavipes]|nr:histone-lysine N-methyltransferase SETMAR [Trichonephila clavipes]
MFTKFEVCGGLTVPGDLGMIDEAWLYHYNPTIKQQSSEWKHPSSPTLKKAKTMKSAGKVMTIFFYYEGIVYQHAVEPGTTVKDSYYSNILRTMIQHVKRKSIASKWFPIAPWHCPTTYCSLRTGCFAAEHNVEILLHTPYSPDLTPCDCWLFPQLKKPLRDKRFASNKACVKAAEAVLKQLSQNGLLHVFKKSSTSSKIDYGREREPLHRSIKRVSSEKDGEKTRSDRSRSMSPLPLTRRRRSSAEEKVSNSSHFLSVRIRRMLRRNSKRCGINNPFIPSPAAVRICHWSKSRRRRRFPRHTCGECPQSPSCRIFEYCITIECIARTRNNEIISSRIDCEVPI